MLDKNQHKCIMKKLCIVLNFGAILGVISVLNEWYGKGVVWQSKSNLIGFAVTDAVVDIMGNKCSLKICVKKERRRCNA